MRCVTERSSRHLAKLQVSELERLTEYSTNLVLTNAAVVVDGTTWRLYTFANNDLDFVHYTKIPSFGLRVMEAYVVPEVKRFGSSSMLHASLSPQRDLGSYG
jgi:hypothetical protein